MSRLFIALGLPPELQQEVSLLGLGLPTGRPVPADQVHLTLRFLGDIPSDQVQDVDEGLSAVKHPALVLTPHGVGCFPRRKDPRSVWLGLRDSPSLTRLQASVEHALVRVGLPPEGRKFHPHITVSRMSNAPLARVATWLEEHSLFSAAPFRVDELRLIASDLHPTGARHELLTTYPLEGEPGEEGAP